MASDRGPIIRRMVMAKPQNVNEVPDTGQSIRDDASKVDTVVSSSESSEVTYVYLIHPETGLPCKTYDWVAPTLISQGWKPSEK